MAKMITRTIETHIYVFGKLNMNTMQIEDSTTVEFPYKLGARAVKALEKENGAPCIAESTSTALYGMSLDTFLANSEKLDNELVDSGSSDEGKEN